MLTESYPNGMNATYTYNPVGSPISLEYKKTTHCTEEKEKCTWFNDTVVPSIHGQWLEQTSTLSHQAYTYDTAGRLTQVQNTPAGKGCTTRIYAYDEDTNRTSLTTREPNAKGECTTEGGTVEKHTYDEADRLTDTGTNYNTFGDITRCPPPTPAAKNHRELTSTYYTDNQLASQTQNGETIGYNLDPAGRTLETVATGKKASDVTNHYAGPGGSPAWTVNTSGETDPQHPRHRRWPRSDPEQRRNPRTAAHRPARRHHRQRPTSPKPRRNCSPRPRTPASSAYRRQASRPNTPGSAPNELPTELPSGVIAMGARSYVPQLGRFLQPDPRPGGSANAYTYTFGDPVNTSDPSGEFTWGFSESLTASLNAVGQEIIAREAAREAAARAAAEAAARESAEEAAYAAGPQYEGEGEWEEWEEWEEEWYEYASYQKGAQSEGGEVHAEPAVLFQLVTDENAVDGEGGTSLGSTVPLCTARAEGPCARDARSCTNFNPEARCERVYLHRAKAEYASDNNVGGMWDRAAEPVELGYDGYECPEDGCEAFSQDMSEVTIR